MARRRPQRPRDPSQLGKLIVELSVGEVAEVSPQSIDPAKEYASKGGLKGGKARAAALSPEERRAIAQKAARGRWGSKVK